MSARAGLAGVAPQSPRRVLDELVARGQRAAAAGKDRPVAVLELASGRSVSGRPVALADDSGLAMLLLHTGGTERAPQVLQLRVDQVVAVGYEPAGAAPALGAEQGAAPGRLELSRSLAGVEQELCAALGARLELGLGAHGDDDARRAIAALVPTLRQALVRLARDPLGQEALRALAKVTVEAQAGRAVHRIGTVLSISAPADEAPGAWTLPELLAAIEKAL